ncbi:MAG: MerR family transcriptional regulator [Cyanobacteriota bacterium]|nr:MerR family transcriptional regulator [Cyanobacteriota bacterium]
MLKISDFAQLSRVSSKALRLYDRMDLLKPAQVDAATGYRYYSASQLPRLNRILVLKELGFSLDQITQLLDEHLTLEQMQAMLRLKQAELSQRIQQDHLRLIQIQHRLYEIEQEKAMPTYDVILKSASAQWVAATLSIIPNYEECGPIFEQMFTQVYDYLKQQNVVPVSPGLSIYHDTKLRDHDIPVEAAIPLPDRIPANEQVHIYQLPAVESMACVVHQGSFAGLGQAYQALMTWIEQNGYSISGSTREVYLHYDPAEDPNHFVTEVQVPVDKN